MATYQQKQERKAAEAAAKAAREKPAAMLQAYGNDAAPTIYFDGAVAYGLSLPNARVELAMTTSVPITRNGKSEPLERVVMVCHLRGSLEAFAQLGDTIAKTLAMAAPPAEPPAATEKSNA